jgi:uncharacterized protein (TIGR03067 family)
MGPEQNEDAVMIRGWIPQSLLAIVFACLGFGVLVSQEATVAKEPWSELEGEWEIVKARKGNKDADPEQVSQTRVVVKKKSLQVVEPSFTETVEVVGLTVAQGLNQVDLAVAGPDGKSTGKVLEGIFGRQGDKVVFAWSKIPEKGKRPSNFETRSDNIVYLELARAKKIEKKETKVINRPVVTDPVVPMPKP